MKQLSAAELVHRFPLCGKGADATCSVTVPSAEGVVPAGKAIESTGTVGVTIGGDIASNRKGCASSATCI
ncbi:MAG: hypothetical protein ABIT38_05060, partial [Gemmatimonadaceae bacterium]